jgi:hypothetical protein
MINAVARARIEEPSYRLARPLLPRVAATADSMTERVIYLLVISQLVFFGYKLAETVVLQVVFQRSRTSTLRIIPCAVMRNYFVPGRLVA